MVKVELSEVVMGKLRLLGCGDLGRDIGLYGDELLRMCDGELDRLIFELVFLGKNKKCIKELGG